MKESPAYDLEGSSLPINELPEQLSKGEKRWRWHSLPPPILLLLFCLLGFGAQGIFRSLIFGLEWSTEVESSSTSDPVDWQPCPEDSAYLCGFLVVPTDYLNPSAGNSTLALSKYSATCPKAKRLGSIMTNFGGPGVPGRSALLSIGPRLQALFGNRHDIIAYDQRGLGMSLPKVNCFGTDIEYEHFKANTVLESTLSIPKDPFSPEGRAILIEQQKQALALEEAQAGVCREVMGDAFNFMSTTAGVRDMEEISRVLEGGDAKINFFGGSYGSIFGSYLANMLPHKMGRVVIDGIVPAALWANTHYENQHMLRLLLADSEKSLDWFLSDCFYAGPRRCHLAESSDEGPQDIKTRIDDFIDKLQGSPMPVSNYVRPGLLKSGAVRQTLFNFLQMPELWAAYAQLLALAIKGDGAPLLRLSARPFTGRTNQADLGRLAISCGDALPYPEGEPWPTAEEVADDILKTMKEISPRFGGTVHLMEQHGGCQFWPGTGKGPEIYSGPWNKTLETPLLIVSNTHDPVTPLLGGRTVKNDFGNSSRLIVQAAAGHSYLSPENACTAKIVRKYFVEGVVPDEDETFCERDGDNYFPPSTSLRDETVGEVLEFIERKRAFT